jgi:hypothetical protein
MTLALGALLLGAALISVSCYLFWKARTVEAVTILLLGIGIAVAPGFAATEHYKEARLSFPMPPFKDTRPAFDAWEK